MSLFVWLVFTEEGVLKRIYGNRLGFPIPLNCEFIIVAQTNDSTYKLTETYKFKNNTFYFKYGTWDVENYLKVTDIPFNARRSNLNGTEIVISSDWNFVVMYG